MTDDAPETAERIRLLASRLYGERGDEVARDVRDLVARHRLPTDDPRARGRRVPSEGDAMLIAYADQVRAPGERPLATLEGFLEAHGDALTAVHLLPFFPYTSDDGFGVVDYLAVDERAGTWDDVARVAASREVMFDAVINHLSASSEWIQRDLAGDEAFAGFAIDVDPSADLSRVVRPRTTPLATRFDGADGDRWLWTTFSADQVDLNYAEPRVLLAVLDVLCEYVRRGASWLRLDAVAFVWKRLGTSCMSLPETHAIVQLIRAVLDEVAPGVSIITETNVPHAENVSYFGDGAGEAQLVYDFALPPLVLHTLSTGDAGPFVRWLRDRRAPSDQTTFFTFLASHDGIGLRGSEGILSDADRAALARQAERHGGFVSHRTAPGGAQVPYELNISYIDALSDPAAGEDLRTQVDRFLCATALQLAIPGMPGIYLHSLVGSRSDRARAERLGAPRAINRAPLDRDDLERELADPTSRRARVFSGIRSLLAARAASDAFAPSAACAASSAAPGVVRIDRAGRTARATCLQNVGPAPVAVDAPAGHDLITGEAVDGRIALRPYEVRWIGR